MEKKDNNISSTTITSKTRLRDIENAEERKRIYREAREEGKHTQSKAIQAQARNLIPLNERSEEEAREIRRKGAEALNRLKGEKKNAKQILDTLLPIYADKNAIISNEVIPQDIKDTIIKHNMKITQYDLIMLSQIYQAQQGNVKSAEFIANHYGDIVVKETHNINESISEADKQLINNLKDRLNIIDVEVKDVTNNTESDD